MSGASNNQPQRFCVSCKKTFASDVYKCPDDGILLAEVDPLIGTVLDSRYTVEEFLGQGGMSLVYKARHDQLERVVAIKLLKSQLLRQSVNIQRFRREAHAASLLRHPNIDAIYAFGVANGQPYLVLEYLQGRSLAFVLEHDRPLNVLRVFDIFEQICCGLAHAHSRGVVHRDLKPSNVVLINGSDKEQVKLVDFGTAKIALPEENQQQLTQAGEILGTLVYMAPEQKKGQESDGRADIYAVGCMLHESLQACPNAPKEAGFVVERCMQDDPANRYPTASELERDLQALRRFVETKTALPRDFAQPGAGRTLSRRNVALVAMAAIIPLAVLGTSLLTTKKQPETKHYLPDKPLTPEMIPALRKQEEALAAAKDFNGQAALLDELLDRECEDPKRWGSGIVEAFKRRLLLAQSLNDNAKAGEIAAAALRIVTDLHEENQPGSAPFHYEYGKSLIRDGRFREADGELRHAVELLSDDAPLAPYIYLDLGRLARRRNLSRTAAVEYLEKAYELSKSHPFPPQIEMRLLVELAEAYNCVNDSAASRRTCRETLSRFGNDAYSIPRFPDAYSVALTELGKSDEAYEVLKKSFDLRSKNNRLAETESGSLCRSLAADALAKKDYEPAERYARVAIELTTNPPELARSHDYLGRALFGLHNLDQAEAELGKAAELAATSGLESKERASIMQRYAMIKAFRQRGA